MKDRRLKRIVIAAIIVIIGGFVLIQLIPYGRDHRNPAVVSEPNWDSAQTRELVQQACFDCHSNETVWPWYSNVAPFSWVVQHDTEEGRQHLNFSTWGNGGQGREPGEVIEVVNEGQMPPFTYVITHPNAQLSPGEKQILIDGLRATIYQ